MISCPFRTQSQDPEYALFLDIATIEMILLGFSFAAQDRQSPMDIIKLTPHPLP